MPAETLNFLVSWKVWDSAYRKGTMVLHGKATTDIPLDDVLAKVYSVWEAFYPVVGGSIEGCTISFQPEGTWDNYHEAISGIDLETTGVLRWNSRIGTSYPNPLYVPAINPTYFTKGKLNRDDEDISALSLALSSTYPPVRWVSGDGIVVSGLGQGKLAFHHYKNQG